jgi:hypothetical protein
MKKQTLIRISLAFTRLGDLLLIQYADVVALLLFGNAAYPAPPVTAAAFGLLTTGFRDAKTAQTEGRALATATKNAKRELLVAAMRELAAYVQMVGGNNLETLLSSGFEVVVPGSNLSEVLAAPVIEKVKLGQSGELITVVTPVRNSRGYEMQIAEMTDATTQGPWASAGFHTNSRRILTAGLTPGKIYVIRVRAMGGSSGQSDWSAPTSQMCL